MWIVAGTTMEDVVNALIPIIKVVENNDNLTFELKSRTVRIETYEGTLDINGFNYNDIIKDINAKMDVLSVVKHVVHEDTFNRREMMCQTTPLNVISCGDKVYDRVFIQQHPLLIHIQPSYDARFSWKSIVCAIDRFSELEKFIINNTTIIVINNPNFPRATKFDTAAELQSAMTKYENIEFHSINMRGGDEFEVEFNCETKVRDECMNQALRLTNNIEDPTAGGYDGKATLPELTRWLTSPNIDKLTTLFEIY